MKRVFYLSTCDTCRRILNLLELKEKGFYLQDIKTEKITDTQLKELKNSVGSYEALFSKASRQFKARNLSGAELKENDYKNLILEEYTFLKRPVIVYNNKVFVGNSKETIASASETIR